MAEYLIRCVNIQGPHDHILSAQVQKQAGDHYEDRTTLTVATIRSKLTSGDRFETHSPSTQKIAAVHKDTCSVGDCKVETIRSAADAVADNNLDNMICA
jgi:hypothetical protein